MVNGPPTPPPTTAAELQDEARTAATASTADQAPTAPPAQATPDSSRIEVYQSAMPTLIDAITRADYHRLVQAAEDTDFTTASDRQQSRLLVVAPLVLGHIILDDLSPARYALQRLPDNLTSHPLPRALMAVVVSTINRDHAKVYDQTATLVNLVSQPDFMDRDLASIITQLLSAFLDAFRHRTFQLLSNAYTSLPLPLACTYLGLPTEQVLAVTEKNGWSFDSSTQILCPVRTKPLSSKESVQSAYSSLNTFHFVADSVAKLEV